MYETTYLPRSSFFFGLVPSEKSHLQSHSQEFGTAAKLRSVKPTCPKALTSYGAGTETVDPVLNKKIFKDQIRKMHFIDSLSYICFCLALQKNKTLEETLHGSIQIQPAAWIAQSHHGHGHLRPTSSNRGQGQPPGPGLDVIETLG